MTNERTSAKIASVAGKILGASRTDCMVYVGKNKRGGMVFVPWNGIRSMAASLVTQTRDKLHGKYKIGKEPAKPKRKPNPKDSRHKPAAKNHNPIARKIALRSKR
jgi:hypothetical protein